MLSGVLTGFLLRNRSLGFIQPLITLLIWALLFLLGVEVGSNPRIINGLDTLGLEAIVMTAFGGMGSIILAWWLYKWIEKGTSADDDAPHTNTDGDAMEHHTGILQQLKGSLIIVGFFILGILTGVCHILPDGLIDARWSYYELCALMFCVGMTIGSDTKVISKFRNISPKLMLLPLATIVGTLIGSAIASIVLSHRSLTDCLAIGSGFGYYSLSSIFITEYRGAELGTIALLANISREILTLLAAPIIAKKFGKLAPISLGGATSMDTTLPVITRAVGKEYAIVSIYHGFTVDFSVPFLVTFFCSI